MDIMTVLVIGGSGSGKSAFAEEKVVELAGNCPKYYIATMKIWDDEGRKKAGRHVKMREGKNFMTIEQPDDIGSIADLESTGTVLLESMSNLVANEMFKDETVVSEDEVADKICKDIEVLTGRVRDIVIVSDNVFEEGTDHGTETNSYINAMGRVNNYLAGISDEVWEVVCGIPVKVKR